MIRVALIAMAILWLSNAPVNAQDDDELGGMVINFCSGNQWEQIYEAFQTLIRITLAQIDDDMSLTDTEALRALHYMNYQGGKIIAGCSSATTDSESYSSDEGALILIWPGQYLIEVLADKPAVLTIEQTSEVGNNCETVDIATEPFSEAVPQAWMVFPVVDGCGTHIFVETDADVWEVNFRRLAEPDFSFEKPD